MSLQPVLYYVKVEVIMLAVPLGHRLKGCC